MYLPDSIHPLSSLSGRAPRFGGRDNGAIGREARRRSLVVGRQVGMLHGLVVHNLLQPLVSCDDATQGSRAERIHTLTHHYTLLNT